MAADEPHGFDSEVPVEPASAAPELEDEANATATG
jgi:hypothetical protein